MIIPRTSAPRSFRGGVTVIVALLLACTISGAAAKLPEGFTGQFAEVNGTRLHYLIGGKGSPVVLVHGYAETSHMWLPIMPLLAQRHTVIVPDLRCRTLTPRNSRRRLNVWC